MPTDALALGRIGYEAYGAEAEWKNYAGKPMPAWGDLPQHIRDKWAVAANAIGDAIRLETAHALDPSPS